jgi:hypothetical protein
MLHRRSLCDIRMPAVLLQCKKRKAFIGAAARSPV